MKSLKSKRNMQMNSEVVNLEKLVINGGKPLKGEVNICGAKNAAIAI